MSKYRELDALIVQSIRNGRDTFGQLCGGKTGALASNFSVYESDRVIDRRLQSLRKRGAIRFTGKHWVNVESQS